MRLAVSLDLTVAAAVEELSVVGSGTAAGSVTIEGLEWESVWVGTAASLLAANALHAWLDWASLVVAWVESVVVSISVVVDLGSGEKKSEQRVNKLSFDGTSVSGAVVGVQTVARFSQVDTGTGTWSVADFPWDARFAGSFGIDDSALVSVSQSFTESVNFVDWGTFTSSNVVIKVTPASVFVQRVDGVGNVTGKSSEGAVSDKTEKLSVD